MASIMDLNTVRTYKVVIFLYSTTRCIFATRGVFFNIFIRYHSLSKYCKNICRIRAQGAGKEMGSILPRRTI